MTNFEEIIRIPSPIGNLEAKFSKGNNSKKFGIIFCCPHPIYSGTMDMELISIIMSPFIEAGYPTIRFNYRGKGNSDGQYGRGIGERMDVRTVCTHYLSTPNVPPKIVLMGYSFGAAIGSSIVSEFQDIIGYVAISYPFPINPIYIKNASVSRPKLFLWGDADKVISISALESAYADLQEPKEKKVFPGARHSWKTFEENLATFIFSWVKNLHFIK
ncbi:hypothetical protein NEF87_000167 [Candidatus Lokiarchaeum ossiferum]|uniref:Dienelactone hydrolase domain-containing protein n=1 Tax=Candidatus Lokiarchaeum ossiferum TaxID=2951803 RepID=A0ABY6HNA7_9ARCH|nr:hypothetical protein NEF87_000167 [Candidatus Lokiarchaeum sp. B-35]